MLVVAALLGAAMGMVIGGLGGGGGVLTVPALVYTLGQTAQDATTSSVIIVGITALAGASARVRGTQIAWRTGIAFGLVGIPVTYLGTQLNHHVSQPVLLLAFAVITIIAATAMLLDNRRDSSAHERPSGSDADTDTEMFSAGTPSTTVLATRSRPLSFVAKIVVCGSAVGFLTGFLGVGGGFLVVPALVMVLRTPMTLAIATSLLIIAMNSASTLASRLGNLHLNWTVVARSPSPRSSAPSPENALLTNSPATRSSPHSRSCSSSSGF
jgi:hypothetical protein